MRATRLSILTGLIFALFPFIQSAPAGARNANTAALVGQVSSAEEGLMEGVLVSARRDGATITVTGRGAACSAAEWCAADPGKGVPAERVSSQKDPRHAAMGL